jgi:hypothetical protein
MSVPDLDQIRQAQQSAQSHQNQAEEIVNVPVPVKAFGRTYDIKRFSLGQFARSLNYITPLSAVIQTAVREWAMSRGRQSSLADAEYNQLMNEHLVSATPEFRERVRLALIASAASTESQMDRSEWILAIVGALSMSGDSIMGLISVATYEPLEWLDDKDPFEGIELLSVIVEQNLDFFSPEKIAKLRSIAERLTPKINALYGGTLTT